MKRPGCWKLIAWAASAALGASTLTACGGGGGSGTTTPPPVVIPGPTLLTFTANTAYVYSGGSATLNWLAGSGASCTAGGGWSGSKGGSGSESVGPLAANTTFTLSCQTNGGIASSAALTVIVDAKGAPPAPTASKVWSDSNETSLDFVRIPIGIRNLTWSAARARIYATTRADSAVSPSALVAIDPLTQALQAVTLPEEPWSIAVSADGAYVFVGFKTGGTIRRFRTSDLTQDLTIHVGTADSWIFQIEPSPVAPHTIAVLANKLTGPQDDSAGAFIADDATVRPNALYGESVLLPPATVPVVNFGLTDLDWSPDGTRLYAMGDSYTAGLLEVAVNAQGLAFTRRFDWFITSPGTLVGNRWFDMVNYVFNLEGPVGIDGRLADYGNTSQNNLPVPARNKGFIVSDHLLPGNFLDGMTLYSFDLANYTITDSIVFNGPANVNGAILLPWGTDGLALKSLDELVITRGSFAAAGGTPPPYAGSLMVAASGVSPSATSNDILSYRVYDVGARAAVAACDKVYVTTSGASFVRPNSLLELDLANATITRSTGIGSEPNLIEAADDCSTLYVGHQYTNSVARVRTADFAVTGTLPLDSNVFAPGRRGIARSLSVAPGQPQTVAISAATYNASCNATDEGVVIFDGDVPRPVWLNERIYGIRNATFGATANVLYAQDFDNTSVFTVGANGLSNPRALMPYKYGNTFQYDLGLNLYYDRLSARLYDLFGYVYDTTAGAELPRIALTDTPAIDAGCATPWQARTTDPATGKLYWIGLAPGFGALGISAYARNGLARLGRFVIQAPESIGSYGIPQNLMRLPGNRLAFVTSRGYVIVLEGPLLAP